MLSILFVVMTSSRTHHRLNELPWLETLRSAVPGRVILASDRHNDSTGETTTNETAGHASYADAQLRQFAVCVLPAAAVMPWVIRIMPSSSSAASIAIPSPEIMTNALRSTWTLNQPLPFAAHLLEVCSPSVCGDKVELAKLLEGAHRSTHWLRPFADATCNHRYYTETARSSSEALPHQLVT